MEKKCECNPKKRMGYGRRFIELFLLSAIGIHIFCMVILASVPPVSRDALIHHLAIPKMYLLKGGIYEIPSMHYSYFPMNLDLLYILPLYFNHDIAAKYIHFCFALLTAGFIYFYLKDKLSSLYGLLGGLFFLTIPVIVKLSVTAYVDLGLIFFSWICLYFFLKWYDTQFKISYFIFSAISCGLALGTKYNGMILLPIMGSMASITYSLKQNRFLARNDNLQRYKNALKGVQWGGMFILIALIIFSPWMIRNIIWKQNPLYPMYQNVFHAPSNENRQKKISQPHNAFWIRRHIYKESFWQTVLIPVRAFFQGQDDKPQYFDGKLNPCLLLLSLIALVGLRQKRWKYLRPHVILFMIFASLFILFVLFKSDFRIRYMAPAIPPLVVLSTIGVKQMVRFIRKGHRYTKWLGGMGTILLVGFAFGYNVDYLQNQFQLIQPFAYLSGKVDRNTYISHFIQEHPVIQYANRTLSKDARVLCLSIGDRTYHLDRSAHLAEDFYDRENGRFFKASLLNKMTRYGTTHIIFNKFVFLNWVQTLSLEDRDVFRDLFKNYTKVLFEKNGVQLLELQRGRFST